MYFKTSSNINSNFLNFLATKNEKIIYSKEITYTTLQPYKLDTVTPITILITNILKKKIKLNFINVFFHLNPNNFSVNNYRFVLINEKNHFNFYSNVLSINLLNYTNKNNFVNLQIINLTMYLSIKKYYSIFFKNDKDTNLENSLITNVSETFQEIIEIKPDKSKKVYFKKKQTKVFTYLSEFDKNYTYVDANFIDEGILNKNLFIKNILNSSILESTKEKTTFNSRRILSNKSLGFWKRPYHSIIQSGLVLDNYVAVRSEVKYIFPIRHFITNNVIVDSFPLDFNSSAEFNDLSLSKSVKTEFYKNMFLYNFINLFTKVSPINYTYNYTYFNHVPEFKDYFFKKINPLSRDITVYNYKNKNKFNNFFPLYCLSFKKFKKLILFSKKQQSPTYSSYYMYYLVNFLELMCKKKVWIRINTKKQVSDEVYGKFTALFLKNKADQVNIGKHFFLIEFYEIIYLSFINRDINFFAMWFKKIMEKIHLKKHRKMVKVIHSTIRNNLLFLELTGVKGFSMDVRGKLGTAGNSKKKHYAFTVGSIAPTTKSHGLNLYQTTVRTSTGVLGVTILMSY